MNTGGMLDQWLGAYIAGLLLLMYFLPGVQAKWPRILHSVALLGALAVGISTVAPLLRGQPLGGADAVAMLLVGAVAGQAVRGLLPQEPAQKAPQGPLKDGTLE